VHVETVDKGTHDLDAVPIHQPWSLVVRRAGISGTRGDLAPARMDASVISRCVCKTMQGRKANKGMCEKSCRALCLAVLPEVDVFSKRYEA
jgi:hypothetical protein